MHSGSSARGRGASEFLDSLDSAASIIVSHAHLATVHESLHRMRVVLNALLKTQLLLGSAKDHVASRSAVMVQEALRDVAQVRCCVVASIVRAVT